MRSGILGPVITFLGIAGLAAGCGGGGGGYGGGGGGGGGPPPDPTYTAGTFNAPSTYAAYCAAPRTGTDPYNSNQPYPDRLGSAVWEKFWIRSWTEYYYLWYQDLPDINPALASYTTDQYFQAMKTSATNPSGTPKDKPNFHFTYPTATWEALSQSGVQVGYGVTWALVAVTPPRQALVAYTEPASAGYPATSANVNLVRGASILTVDGVDLVNAGDQASVDKLNQGLFPTTVGESHTFTVMDPGASSSRTITMSAVSVTETPVQNVATIATAAGPVGYLTFNDHIATAESEIIAAINQFVAAGVTDLILDIRYNGGGYLDLASEVAYMVAGSAQTSGKTFDLLQFNSKYPTTDPILNQPITPTPFWNTTQGFSTTAGQALPSLNLTRVFVLTGSDTCSASEAIINSLNGINVEVILIGSETCGKPYGFYPQDNCGTTYFSIEFRGVNNAGFGDYGDGFVAQNTTSTTGYKIPGCSVADDFAHALGDPNEGRLAAALAYRASGGATCPNPTGLVAPGLHAVEAHVVKPEWLKNRILRHHR
ncbi:MAG TPA: S41 family peptidase [Steroidobacteraceae bacterium]|nr:S41 family peptidase [Steroidobacteraceae bacterium]